MKRLFFAFTALAMLVTSCAKDVTTTPAVVEGESVVSFKIATPKMATRYGEGTTANKLFYAVYQNDVLKEEVSALTAAEAVDINLTADVEIRLVSGLTYKILFWAQNEDAPYTFDGAKVTITGDLAANEEAYDAFFRNYEAVINGTTPHYVELYRPFAQLNIGTNDIEDAKKAAFDLAKTSITVTTNTVLDLTTGVASEPKELAYVLNTKADDEYEGYDIIAINYLLVGNAGKELIDVKFEAEAEAGKKISRAYTSVPVERNHKTYMLGEILTTTSLFNIVIIPGFEGILPETEAEKLAMAAQMGGTYTMTEDAVLTEPLVINNDFVLNLNGKKISAGLKQEGRHHYAIDNYANLTLAGPGEIDGRGVENFGTMTINGDITITNLDTNGGSAIWNEGDLTINGGTFQTNAEAGTGSYGGALNTQANAKATINGGTFIANSQRTYAILNEGGTTIIKEANVSGKHGAVGHGNGGKTEIYGGTFAQIDNPGVSDHCIFGEVVIYGGTFSIESIEQKNGGKVFYNAIIAEGYEAVEKDGAWVVLEKGIDNVIVAGTAEDLMTALNSLTAGNKVELEKDIDLTGEEWSVSMPWQGSTTDVVFDGKGHKIIGLSTSGLQGGLLGKYNSNGNITIKNLTLVDVAITGTNANGESAGGALIGWIENHGGASIVTIENVKVEGIKAEGFKYIGGLIGYNQGATMNITGCSVIGKADSYLNSTYNESGNYKGHVGGLLGLWNQGTLTNSEVKDLTIKHGTTDMTGSSNRAGALVGTKYAGVEVVSATVENVTVDGAAATAASLFGPGASKVSDSDKANVTIK